MSTSPILPEPPKGIQPGHAETEQAGKTPDTQHTVQSLNIKRIFQQLADLISKWMEQAKQLFTHEHVIDQLSKKSGGEGVQEMQKTLMEGTGPLPYAKIREYADIYYKYMSEFISDYAQSKPEVLGAAEKVTELASRMSLTPQQNSSMNVLGGVPDDIHACMQHRIEFCQQKLERMSIINKEDPQAISEFVSYLVELEQYSHALEMHSQLDAIPKHLLDSMRDSLRIEEKKFNNLAEAVLGQPPSEEKLGSPQGRIIRQGIAELRETLETRSTDVQTTSLESFLKSKEGITPNG